MPKPHRLKSPTPGRTHYGSAEAVERHARQIGQIIIAWNELQRTLFEIFWMLVSPENHELAHGLWHTIQSDKTQREMLDVVAEASLKKRPRMLAHVRWITWSAQQLSPHRNDPAHTPMLFPESMRDVAIPDSFSGRKAAVERLRAVPTVKRWRIVRGDLVALSSFAYSVATHIQSGEGGFLLLPNRPRLRLVPTRKPRVRRKSRLDKVKVLSPQS